MSSANTTCHGCPQEVSHGAGRVGGEERRCEGTRLVRETKRVKEAAGGGWGGVGLTPRLRLRLSVGVRQMPGEHRGCRVTCVVRHGARLEARSSEEVRF